MPVSMGVPPLHTSGDRTPDGAGLAVRIRDGDPLAETELVTRYRDGLCLMLRRHVKEVALAEDLCHDVFRIALPALREGGLRDPAKLTGYLWGIARNLASHDHRVRSRERCERMDISAAGADPSPDAEDRCVRLERDAIVRRALVELSARDREVLRDFYLKGQPKETICRRYALTPPQFDVIKHRALRRLGSILNATGGVRV